MNDFIVACLIVWSLGRRKPHRRWIFDRWRTSLLCNVYDECVVRCYRNNESLCSYYGGKYGMKNVTQALGASQRVFQLASAPFKPPVTSGLERFYSEINHTTDLALTSQEVFKGEIVLKNVSFAYPQDPSHEVLHSISMIFHLVFTRHCCQTWREYWDCGRIRIRKEYYFLFSWWFVCCVKR